MEPPALLQDGAAGGVLFVLLREFEIDDRLAAGLAACFSISAPLVVTLLRNGRELDAAAILVITLGCLFLIPLAYAVWAQHPVDRAALWDLALVALPALLVYAYLRTSIVALGENYQPGYEGPVSAAYALRHRRRACAAVLLVFVSLDLGYAVYMQLHGVRHGLDSSGPPARGQVY